jgi:glutathione S-transferase
MLYLYHGTTSVCSVKARLALDEKSLAWDGEILDLQRGDQHRPDYVKLNPNHVVPTLVHDGKVVIESTLIMEYVEDAFPEPGFMPRDPYERARARLWLKKVDELHPACSTVTFAIAFRPGLLKLGPDQLEQRFKAMPDPAYRERQRLSILHGLDAPHVPPAVQAHDKFFAEMEEALSRAPHLAGATYTFADAAALPYVNRAQMLGMERLWTERRPRLTDWFARMRGRPTFERSVMRWIPAAERQRFAAAGEVWPKVRAIVARDK